MTEEMVPAKKAMNFLGLKKSAFYESVKKVPGFPQPYKVGLRASRFNMGELQSYRESSRRNTVAQGEVN